MKIILAGFLAYCAVWCVVFIAAYSSKRRGWLLAGGGAAVTLATTLLYQHGGGEPLSYQIAISLWTGALGGTLAASSPGEILLAALEGLASLG